jgi:hypothetical protein
VCWVRLVRHPSGLRAEVAGVLKRRPVTRSVPLAVAAELIDAGMPVVVRPYEDPVTTVEAVPA